MSLGVQVDKVKISSVWVTNSLTLHISLILPLFYFVGTSIKTIRKEFTREITVLSQVRIKIFVGNNILTLNDNWLWWKYWSWTFKDDDTVQTWFLKRCQLPLILLDVKTKLIHQKVTFSKIFTRLPIIFSWLRSVSPSWY